MKYFIAYVTVIDGEHEHIVKHVFTRSNIKILKKELDREVGSDNGYFTWGDGMSIVKSYEIEELSESDYNILNKYI